MEKDPGTKDSDEDRKKAPFYSTFVLPPLKDEDVLPLYAIYRNVSRGQTLEPFESLLQEHPELAELTEEDEQAA